MNVFAWAGGNDGCAWWRLHTGVATLRQLGHTINVSEFAVPNYAHNADTIIGQRVAKEGPSLRWRQWATDGKFCVYDIDDHLGALDPSSREAHAYYTHPDNKARLESNLRHASRIIAATPRLADWASSLNQDVIIVRNGLPAEILAWPRRDPHDLVTIGWVGSGHTLPELTLAAPALRVILDHNPGRVELHIVGVDPNINTVRTHLAKLRLDHPSVRITPWLPPGLAYLRAIDFDIWVAPYRGTPFNHAKVPTKSIEAICLGIPLVASNVGSYPKTIRHGETGLIVHQPYQWARHLQRLIDDTELRTRMGDAAHAEAYHHVVEGLAPQWLRALTPN